MTSTDLLHLNEHLDLNADQLEAALRLLWQEATESADGPPVARVQVMNLIVYCEDLESAALADDVLARLPERHPCRAIVLEVLPDRLRPLSASVSARCLSNPSGERRVCSEQITVYAGADTRAVLVDALRPLIVADLPVLLWWTGRPRPADPVFRQFGAGLVDRVLVDSALFRDPGAGLLALARWRVDDRIQASVSDLSWERLRPWRYLLAQTVDPPEARERLQAVHEVVIGYAGEGAPTEEALLAAGWLAASLEWEPEDSPGAGRVTLRADDRRVSLRFEPRPGGDGPLHYIELRAPGSVSFTVRASDDRGIGVSSVQGLSTPVMDRTVPFVHRDLSHLIIAGIGRPGHDPVYDAALACAAEIALLGATA
jgi:glucose-6-phosphate dehydrogenase assembly protein OpcA